MEVTKWNKQDQVRHIDGRIGTVLNVMLDADGSCFLRIAFESGESDVIQSSYFQKIDKAFSL